MFPVTVFILTVTDCVTECCVLCDCVQFVDYLTDTLTVLLSGIFPVTVFILTVTDCVTECCVLCEFVQFVDYLTGFVIQWCIATDNACKLVTMTHVSIQQ